MLVNSTNVPSLGAKQGRAQVHVWWDFRDVREMLLNYGDALLRVAPFSASSESAAEQARQVYELGAQWGFFRSPLQRPVHAWAGGSATGAPLRSLPVWEIASSPTLHAVHTVLQDHWLELRAEALQLLGGGAGEGGLPSLWVAEGRSLWGGYQVLSGLLAAAAHWLGIRWHLATHLFHVLGLYLSRVFPLLHPCPQAPTPCLVCMPALACGFMSAPCPGRRGGSIPGLVPANSQLLAPSSRPLTALWWAARARALPGALSQFFLLEQVAHLSSCARSTSVALQLALAAGFEHKS